MEVLFLQFHYVHLLYIRFQLYFWIISSLVIDEDKQNILYSIPLENSKCYKDVVGFSSYALSHKVNELATTITESLNYNNKDPGQMDMNYRDVIRSGPSNIVNKQNKTEVYWGM